MYYSQNTSLISDYDYDQLYKQLLEYETQNPSEIVDYSPSLKVGAAVDTTFASVTHRNPLLSLENTYNIEELNDFEKAIKSALGASNAHEYDGYVLEPKIDGLSISAKYTQGKLVQALTRGRWSDWRGYRQMQGLD